MLDLSDWTEDYVRDEVAKAKESLSIERKASEKIIRFDDVAKKEMAKQVCAFSNSGAGLLVYGITDDKSVPANDLDKGVPDKVGRQSIEDWISRTIPAHTFPPIHKCESKLLKFDCHHSGHGLLVVSIPLSDYRPHWTKDQEKSYIRVDGHSLEMPRQTFLDIAGRGQTSTGIVDRLEIEYIERSPGGAEVFRIRPHITITSGPICQQWAFEVVAVGVDAWVNWAAAKSLGNDRAFLVSHDPLFPGAVVPVGCFEVVAELERGRIDHVKLSLYTGARLPDIQTLSREELIRQKGSIRLDSDTPQLIVL